MLIEKLSNPYIKFMVTAEQLPADEKCRPAKQAFLYIIAKHSAFKFAKQKMLERVLAKCPDAMVFIDDLDMIKAFKDFRDLCFQRGEIISTAETGWARKYLRSEVNKKTVEEIIYYSLLCGDSHLDKIRREFNWMIDEHAKRVRVLTALASDIGNKRKMELAEEFGFHEKVKPCRRSYFKKLLWDRHYDQAEELGMDCEEDAIEAVVSNLNAGYFDEALEIVNRFLKNRDMKNEIERIMTAMNDREAVAVNP